MTVTDDKTAERLEVAPEPGSVLELVQLLEEAVVEQRAYCALVQSLNTPAGVLKYFDRLPRERQDEVLACVLEAREVTRDAGESGE